MSIMDRCKVCCNCARGMHDSFATLTLFFDGFEVFRIVEFSNDFMGLVQDVLYIQDVYTAVFYILVLLLHLNGTFNNFLVFKIL